LTGAELLTAPPLKGFGEDVERVAFLIRDDPDTLQRFRAATTAPNHRPTKESSPNRTTKAVRGSTRAYTLDRLKRKAPDLQRNNRA